MNKHRLLPYGLCIVFISLRLFSTDGRIAVNFQTDNDPNDESSAQVIPLASRQELIGLSWDETHYLISNQAGEQPRFLFFRENEICEIESLDMLPTTLLGLTVCSTGILSEPVPNAQTLNVTISEGRLCSSALGETRIPYLWSVIPNLPMDIGKLRSNTLILSVDKHVLVNPALPEFFAWSCGSLIASIIAWFLCRWKPIRFAFWKAHLFLTIEMIVFLHWDNIIGAAWQLWVDFVISIA